MASQTYKLCDAHKALVREVVFFNFTQFVILINESILNLALSGMKELINWCLVVMLVYLTVHQYKWRLDAYILNCIILEPINCRKSYERECISARAILKTFKNHEWP